MLGYCTADSSWGVWKQFHKKNVAASLQKLCNVGAVLADRGSKFHARAAATGNARSLSVEWLGRLAPAMIKAVDNGWYTSATK
jgi:hypothetical protein